MKIDLHCHTEASWDCITPLEAIPERCRAKQITIQAITDHDEIWGAQRLRDMTRGSDLTIIVGQEITTADGELIGLFLEQRIEPGLSAETTVRAIREQGGLVLLPHGFDPLKRKRLHPGAVERICHDIDIVEVFNTRVSKPERNNEAMKWALRQNKLKSGGSDAHTLLDIGSAWTAVPSKPIITPADLKDALRQGQIDGKWVHPARALAYKVYDWARFRFKSRVGRLQVKEHRAALKQ